LRSGGALPGKGAFNFEGLRLENVIVEGKLCGEPFHKSEWPNELLDLRPDVTIIRQENKRADFFEAKTTGGDLKRKFEDYPKICEYLMKHGWKSELYFLISHGIENRRYLPELSDRQFNVILWEDVFLLAASTPLGKLVDETLVRYAERAPE